MTSSSSSATHYSLLATDYLLLTTYYLLRHPRKADEAQTVSGVRRSSNNIKKPPSPIASQSFATLAENKGVHSEMAT